MIVVCSSCSARFQYDEARFQGVQSKRFRCPKCSAVFDVVNPHFLPTGPQPEVPTPSTVPPVPPPVPPPPVAVEPPPPQATFTPPGMVSYEMARETTAKRDRGAMLAAAGLKDGMPVGMRFSLVFLSGSLASTVRIIDKPQFTLGREEGDILTGDPETSRRHALLEIRADGTAWITDMNSTNGTFVDGNLISGSVQLHDRQEFTCGQSTFMLLIRKDDGSFE